MNKDRKQQQPNVVGAHIKGGKNLREKIARFDRQAIKILDQPKKR